MTQPKRQYPDPRSIPPLQIVREPQIAGGPANGAIVRLLPVLGLRAGLVALGAVAAIATPVILLTDHHRSAGERATASTTRHRLTSATNSGRATAATRPAGPVATSSAVSRLLPATVLASRLRGHEVSVPKHAPSRARTVQRGPLDLSLSELATSVESGSSAFAPPAYLVNDYRRVGRDYRIPWRLLAATNYIESGYASALGARRDVVVEGRGALNDHVLARSFAAYWQPSRTLISDARELAADGAARAPARAIYKYTGSYSYAQQVLTVAQQIGAEGVTASSTPMLKLVAMQNEAHLLNGLPYVWGGGHTNPAWVVSSGYDCSGFVSEVLHAAGYLSSPQTTQTLPAMAGILNGPGKYVTIYDRTIATERVWVKKKVIKTVRRPVNPATVGVHVDSGRAARSSSTGVSIRLPKWVGEWETVKITKLVPSLDKSNNDEHVIIDLDGQWWESGGSTADGGAEMVHQITKPNAAYLKSFNKRLHPSGL